MRDPDLHVKVYAALRDEGLGDKAAYEAATRIEANEIEDKGGRNDGKDGKDGKRDF